MLLAAIVLQASAAGFSPPLDAPIRVITESRQDARVYRLERQIRFLREGEGYRAEVAQRSAVGDAPDSSGSLAERAFDAFAGKMVVFHLDRAGAVTSIDDLPSLWALLCGRVAAIAASRGIIAPADRARLAERIAGPLRAMPADRQRAMLASLVSAVIADAPMTPGTAPVRLAAKAAMADAPPLDGTRTVLALPGGTVRSTISAASDRLSLERVTDMDPSTGLITRNVKTVRVRAGGQEKVIVTTLSVEMPAGKH